MPINQSTNEQPITPSIMPTIGQAVHYWPSDLEAVNDEIASRSDLATIGPDLNVSPLAAIITHIWSSYNVNLVVFDARGFAHARLDVRLAITGMSSPTSMAHWSYPSLPKCQQEQAAKPQNTGSLDERIAIAVQNQADANVGKDHYWPATKIYCDGPVSVYAIDDVGPGGAHHEYFIEHHNKGSIKCGTIISFQKGAVQEHGTNGLTNEALLAVVRHRFESFQEGPFACDENSAALIAVCKAMHALEVRTDRRRKAGLEGHAIEQPDADPISLRLTEITDTISIRLTEIMGDKNNERDDAASTTPPTPPL